MMIVMPTGHIGPDSFLRRVVWEQVVVAATLIGALALTWAMAVSTRAPQAGASNTAPTWTELSSGDGLELSNGSLAYDPSSSQLVLFGGFINALPSPETWTWSGTTWSQITPATSPPGRANAAMAFDPATNQLVLFGGFGGNNLGFPTTLDDTWTWSGTDWTPLSPATSPPALSDATMAYDSASRQLLLFGGQNGTSVAQAGTWTWNGRTWKELSPATSPPALSDATMAYDSTIRQLLLFGGQNGTSVAQAGTWTWNGRTWKELSPATSPPARAYASMTYDAASKRVVLFGGATSSGYFDDTWTWDGASWTQAHPHTSPTARDGASFAYDPAISRPVLFGGFDGDTHRIFGDTWSF